MIASLQHKPEPGSVLYHYCSPQTLLAILRGGRLRFSDVRSMNDTTEFSSGAELLGQIMAEVPQDGSRGAIGAAVLGPWFAHAKGVLEQQGMLMACCLSRNGDVLSQWRAYADNGGGYCIGLDASALVSMEGSAFNVCYDPSEQRRHLKSAFKYILASTDAYSSADDQAPLMRAMLEMLLDTIAMKNYAFREEDEVRLVYQMLLKQCGDALVPVYDSEDESGRLDFQMKQAMPVPFIDRDIPGGRNAVKEIVIGPRAEVEERALRIMLGSLGYQGVKLTRSSVPYR